MGIKHAFTNPKANSGDATITQPSDWNASHLAAEDFALSGDITPTALSANADDWAPTGLSTASVIRVAGNDTTLRQITGLTGGADGRVILIHNIGTGWIGLKDSSVSSAAANRFALPGDLILLPDDSCLLQYDSTSLRWRAIGHATAATDPALTFSTTNVGGTSPYFVRADDQLALFDATVPVTQAFADAAVAGSAAVAARRDHKHGMPAAPAGGTPAPVLSTSNVAGNAATFLRTNDQLALFDTTLPARTFSDGSVGTAAVAARRDHQHPGSLSNTGVEVKDDFFYTAGVAPANGASIGWASAYFVSGSVLMSQIFPGTGNHPGIVSLSTTTSATGVAGIIASNAQIVFGGGRCRYRAWVQVPVLSDGTNRFGSTVGFFDTLTTFAANVDGCFFHYTDNVNSGAWSVTTIANSVSTATSAITTGITVVAGTWYLLEVDVNAAGTSVDYYVDGVLKVTHTTNIPVGAGRETGVGVFQAKSIGTTARLFHIDAHYLDLGFTTAR